MGHILSILPFVFLSIGLVLCAFEIKKLKDRIDFLEMHFNKGLLAIQFPEVYRHMQEEAHRYDSN